MQRFIEDLLLYSRTSNVEKIFELTDLNTVLENCKQELSQQIEGKSAIIKSSTTLPTLTAIPFQIQQLFDNVIFNSIKYSKPGIAPVISIDSNIVSPKDLPDQLAGRNNNYYKISFSDNGIGFDQTYGEKIFTIFYRLHNKTEYTGTGVGLAICKLIVDNHKGLIRAEGIPNVGATIIIYLPE
jgi:light-regulated signal transduction histidine kinase (bacteriophytochrome)